MGVAQLIRDHRGLWAMGGQDLILGYGEILCRELHCSQIYRPVKNVLRAYLYTSVNVLALQF